MGQRLLAQLVQGRACGRQRMGHAGLPRPRDPRRLMARGCELHAVVDPLQVFGQRASFAERLSRCARCAVDRLNCYADELTAASRNFPVIPNGSVGTLPVRDLPDVRVHACNVHVTLPCQHMVRVFLRHFDISASSI